MTSLIEIQNLAIEFATPTGPTMGLRGLDLSVAAGEIVALIGESGCGKSVAALSILRLLPAAARIAGGTIRLDGRDLLLLSPREMRQVRGNDIAMVFQEPMSALNPAMTIGRQIAEQVVLHRGATWREARIAAKRMLDRVRMPDAAARLDEYPHRLSGGMRQRAMIAMAFACKPRLVIADEPTTAIDVTIQAQILALMREFNRDYGTAILLITHDLGVVAETADRVAVMYAGRKIEEAGTATLLRAPAHPYTRALIAAMPMLDAPEGTVLTEIPGTVPILRPGLTGCAFAPRCGEAMPCCRDDDPSVRLVADSHEAACHRVTP